MAEDRTGTSRFELIQGSWVSGPEWLAFPSVIVARTPEDRNRFCKVRVARSDLLKGAEARRRQPAYEFWSVLSGLVPPVPHQEIDADKGLLRLSDAHACFKGIKRPLAEDANGDGVIAYVLKPTKFFAYEFRPPVVLTTKETVPNDLVFMAYVRLDAPSAGNGVRGVLIHWGFVEAQPGSPNLPVDFMNRYTIRLW